MAKKKLPGHYCRICGERKPNESFTGKGHAKHICKVCDALPQERKNELQVINRIESAAMKYPRTRQDWELLEKYAKSNKYPEARSFAQSFLDMNRSQADIEPDDEYIFDNPDIDSCPVFLETRKFSELDNFQKMLLRDYIRSAITEHWECSGSILKEHELIELRKQMLSFFEEEEYFTLKNDSTLRQFFETNATNTINKLPKKDS